MTVGQIARTLLMTLMLAGPLAGGAEAQGPPRAEAAGARESGPAAADRDGFESPDGLGGLIAELERQNPALRAARREVDMHAARIVSAGAPPDPTLSVGYMSGFLRPPFFPSPGTPDGARQFGISQEIPYPGKLRLKSRVAAAGAEAARWEYEDVRVRLIADLKVEYFDYVYVDRSVAIVRRSKELLEQLRRTAEVRFAVGKAIQQDVLRAQLEISLLLERLALLEQERETRQARINSLLNRPVASPVDARLAVRAARLPGPPEDLLALAAGRYPALRREERRIDQGQQALALANRDLMPDFAVSFTSRRQVGDMPWMYGVDFMVRLPIFWQRKQRPLIAEAAAALESSRERRDEVLAAAAAEVTTQYLAAETSRRLMDLYRDSILPQARLALESARAAYEVGTADFLTLLTNFVTLLTYEIGHEEQQSRFHQALARLEPMTGLVLVD